MDAHSGGTPGAGNGTGFVYDSVFLNHDTGPGHVERPERLQAILARLQSRGILSELQAIQPQPATREMLERVHSERYVARAEHDILSGRPVLSTDPGGSDTRIGTPSLAAARMAAGAVVAAVDAVMAGRVRNAFCCVRPPGHHATISAGMGFCIFNNVAVGVRHLQAKYNITRVLVMDWDVHHGNGTEDIFADDPTVFFASSHQWGIYPGTGDAAVTGEGEGAGTTLNMPLPPGTPERQMIDLWTSRLVPAMESFRPEFVFISAGFDSHEDDLLGSLRMTDDGFRELTRLAMSIAANYAGGRLVSVLEGGYNLSALSGSVEAHVRELMA